ncbi:hypothetical protein D3C80_1683600 [compost metagenome]
MIHELRAQLDFNIERWIQIQELRQPGHDLVLGEGGHGMDAERAANSRGQCLGHGVGLVHGLDDGLGTQQIGGPFLGQGQDP